MKAIITAIFFVTSYAWAKPPQAPTLLRPPIEGGAERVVALSPALTELIYAMGLENKLVGVSDFSDFPPAAKKKKSVGPYTKPNAERILALKPDLVFVPQEGPEDTRHELERIKVHYAVISMRKLDDIGAAAEMIATLLEAKDKGENFRKEWDEKLKNAFGAEKPPRRRVLVEIQSTPLIGAGRETFLDEIVNHCGGDNVVRSQGYPRLSVEALAVEKLDVIFLADHFSNDGERLAAAENWKKFPGTKGAEVIPLNPDSVSRPGPRLTAGIKDICGALRKGKP